MEKYFFAFLDKLGHLEAKKNINFLMETLGHDKLVIIQTKILFLQQQTTTNNLSFSIAFVVLGVKYFWCVGFKIIKEDLD